MLEPASAAPFKAALRHGLTGVPLSIATRKGTMADPLTDPIAAIDQLAASLARQCGACFRELMAEDCFERAEALELVRDYLGHALRGDDDE